MVKYNMKRKLLILLAAVAAVATPMVEQAQAISFEIAVGDRPYYHGGGYWHEGYYWVLVPGHYSPRRGGWGPGHYVRRGGYNAIYAPPHYRPPRGWIEKDRRGSPNGG